MSRHDAFTAALLAPDLRCPDGLYSSNGAEPASRFAVYRNNVHSSLVNALAAAFPVTLQLVGDAFFRAMAGLYAQAHPPTSPLMSEYGSAFACFIEGFEPAASVPYLADMARLERLRVQAYHAADSQPLDQQTVLQALQGQTDLGGLRVRWHPSLATLDSTYAVVALWAAHQTERGLENLDPWQPQSALVLRQGLEVKVFAVNPDAVAFINSLAQGATLENAVEHALEAGAEFDLHQCLALLISHNAITHLHPEQKVSP
ncbi:DNA-binding domain-containing protein [Pseudomonas allii]|uniref:DNA-binding domain-containing protein n=2 Tax=Pseudomonas allii TaxID=2740531 RepID=A0ACC6L6F9_9PSED|nr:DNA-binding domain-containing protein [Pseudomonas allii]MDR9873771.1 DNA-binding domain-containing protein [Pseudomonas allii]NWN46523.1 putative DNA-binding domain-containing protein [Pseudomonas allii]NWN63038.1 putative DNA-binding domain-containing protein [Pseudomonas allii]